MSTGNSEPNYAGVPLPEVRISTQRLLMAETTEKVLNAIVTVKDIRQINLKGESLPATINSGPNRGIANNHSERRMIKYGDKEFDVTPPWNKIDMTEAVIKATGIPFDKIDSDEEAIEAAK